jgi:hypothetical protein
MGADKGSGAFSLASDSEWVSAPRVVGASQGQQVSLLCHTASR